MITCTASLVGPRPSGSTLTGSSALRPIGKEFLSGRRPKVQLRGPVFKTVQLEHDSGAGRLQDGGPVWSIPVLVPLVSGYYVSTVVLRSVQHEYRSLSPLPEVPHEVSQG
ncbi:unnamed protein product [Arctogadus glacialis]